TMKPNLAGYWYISETPYGPLVHAQLGLAEDNSGKLVTKVRQEARRLAEENKARLIITDGPPGVGCPVISCLSGTDLALVVTEPTLSGKHDLERVLNLVEHFHCQAAVCINKWDLDPENTRAVEVICGKRRIPVIGRLPYDERVMEAVKNARPVVQDGSGPVVDSLLALWDEIKSILMH
ncbi:MAG TPA: (4Fe-4S)-binding protein, partial [Desulfotomaculum sp.]|nr:(4Fe-4S)-binding protein [Desulfotomaculum sp.]